MRGWGSFAATSVVLVAWACGDPFEEAFAPAPAPTGTVDPSDASTSPTQQKCTDGLFGKPNRVDELNLKGEDLGMWLSVDALRVYLAGRIVTTGDPDVFFWSRASAEQPFTGDPGAPIALRAVNDTEATTRVALTPDEKTIILEYDTGTARYLRTSTRSSASADFPKPTNIVFTTVAGNPDASGLGEDPYVQHDGKALYFVRTDLRGDRRIHVAAARDASSWATPIALDLGNSPQFDDASPVLSHDGLTLFFASAHADGKRLDIYMRERASPTVTFEGNAQNLGDVVNSAADEYPIAVSNDACTLYFVSRRDGGVAHVWKTGRTR